MSKSSNTYLCEEYFRLQQEYEEKFGKKVIIFMEVGGFFEAYSYDPSKDPSVKLPEGEVPKILGKAHKVHKICGLAFTSRSKKLPHSIKNPFMCGCPSVAYERHRDRLISEGYKVIKMVQEKRDGKISRVVEEIGSVGTLITNLNSLPVTNNIGCIYLEVMKSSKRHLDYQICCGLSMVDVSTGVNTISEVYSKVDDPATALQGIYRFLLSISPRELYLYLTLPKEVESTKYKIFIEEQLELERYPVRLFKINEVPKEFFLPDYQNQFLGKLFPNVMSEEIRIIDHRMIEELDLGLFTYGRISYLLLIDNCRLYNEKLINSLQRPITRWIDEEEHLILAHNAILQLNVIPSNLNKSKKSSIDSLFSVVNMTLTPVGKRLLYTSLVNPITDSNELNWRYSVAEELVNYPELLDKIVKGLKGIPDLERYHHKLNLQMISPNELSILSNSYLNITDLYEILYKHIGENRDNPLCKLLLRSAQIREFNEVLDYIYSKVDLDSLSKTIIRDDLKRVELKTTTYLRENINDHHDQLFRTIVDSDSILHQITAHLNSFLGKTRGKLLSFIPRTLSKKEDEKPAKGSSEEDESDDEEDESEMGYKGYLGFVTTESKASKLKGSLSQIDQNLCGKIIFERDRKKVIVTSEKIKELILQREEAQIELERFLYIHYYQMLKFLLSKSGYVAALNRSLAFIDFLQSSAQCCRKYKYHRPILQKSNHSYFKAEEVRHPLAERIIATEYIPNNISVGKRDDQDSDPYGIVIFGVNSSGKSVALKSIGVNIILAQAGYFTACKLIYSPYNKIVTRLSGMDNILKGESSFIVEMMELKMILKEAGPNSLVLVDELTRGTETVSGIALSIATLLTLIDRKASFLFTSHLHDLPKYSKIKELATSQLRICHLSAEYDPKDDELIYIRTLQPGSGSTRYGLEVARSLHLDPSFLELANTIRNDIDPNGAGKHLLSTKTSRYSPKIYVDSCLLCGSKTNLHTHHIQAQSKADVNGFINAFHKDEPFNLMILCDTCHESIHHGGKKIDVQQLLNGLKVKIFDD